MCKKLPYDDFKWHYGRMDEKRVMKYCDDDDIGYILEVDLDYPKELHDLHKDYPLAPEIMCINESMLSQVQKDIHKYYYGKDASDEKTNKLVLNVMDKKKYVLHISALKFYLQHGLSLRKVHRCRSNVVVMRSKPGASLLDALVQVANRTLKKMTTQAKFKPFIPALSAIFSAAVVAFQGLL
jgi:hypothetical protein